MAAGPSGGDSITVWSRQFGGDPASVRIDDLGPGGITGWAAYPLGVAWALRESGLRPGGTRLVVDADLSPGAGLSSSAALECATGLVLTELHHLRVPRRDLAMLASRAENEFAGAPTGIMDQSAALLCQAGHALLLDCRSGATEPVPLDPAADGLTLLVIDTGVRHALTDGRYGARRRSCEEAARQLGVTSLRDLEDQPGDVDKLADEELRRRARHVVSENRRVLTAVNLLRRGALRDVGALLTSSHASLRDDFEVSWPEADVAVEAALSAGAPGARMIGGGFGGSVLALVPDAHRDSIVSAVTASYARRHWAAPAFIAAIPSGSARRWR